MFLKSVPDHGAGACGIAQMSPYWGLSFGQTARSSSHCWVRLTFLDVRSICSPVPIIYVKIYIYICKILCISMSSRKNCRGTASQLLMEWVRETITWRLHGNYFCRFCFHAPETASSSCSDGVWQVVRFCHVEDALNASILFGMWASNYSESTYEL